MHLGIDLGGTKVEIIALDSSNQAQYKKRITSPRNSYQKTVNTLVQLVEEAENEIGQDCSVGIGIPGSISPSTGLIQNANSTWLIGHPLKHDLESHLNRKIGVGNDADCFTLSEACDGAASDSTTVFGVILGTGVGGGICINQVPILGPNAITGEWGHNPMPQSHCEQEKQICYCGRQHCIETYLCGPAFVRHFNASNNTELKRVEEIMSHPDLDQRTQAEQYYTEHLAAALATVVNILDPDCIVVGGGLSNMPFLYKNLKEALLPYVFSDTLRTKIVPARHGDSSGVRGAAWLGKQAKG